MYAKPQLRVETQKPSISISLSIYIYIYMFTHLSVYIYRNHRYSVFGYFGPFRDCIHQHLLGSLHSETLAWNLEESPSKRTVVCIGLYLSVYIYISYICIYICIHIYTYIIHNSSEVNRIWAI